MDFKVKDGEKFRTVRCTKAAGVTIAAGRLVTLSSGNIVEAGAESTAVALAPNGAASADTVVDVTIGNGFTMVGTLSTGFEPETHLGNAYDIAIGVGNAQTINASDTDEGVLQIGISETTGVDDGTAVECRIANGKTLF
jgi:hypothetical protein